MLSKQTAFKVLPHPFPGRFPGSGVRPCRAEPSPTEMLLAAQPQRGAARDAGRTHSSVDARGGHRVLAGAKSAPLGPAARPPASPRARGWRRAERPPRPAHGRSLGASFPVPPRSPKALVRAGAGSGERGVVCGGPAPAPQPPPSPPPREGRARRPGPVPQTAGRWQQSRAAAEGPAEPARAGAGVGAASDAALGRVGVRGARGASTHTHTPRRPTRLLGPEASGRRVTPRPGVTGPGSPRPAREPEVRPARESGLLVPPHRFSRAELGPHDGVQPPGRVAVSPTAAASPPAGCGASRRCPGASWFTDLRAGEPRPAPSDRCELVPLLCSAPHRPRTSPAPAADPAPGLGDTDPPPKGLGLCPRAVSVHPPASK